MIDLGYLTFETKSSDVNERVLDKDKDEEQEKEGDATLEDYDEDGKLLKEPHTHCYFCM